MQQFLSILAVTVWVLCLARGCLMTSEEACRTIAATEQTSCSKKTHGMHETLEASVESDSRSKSTLEDAAFQIPAPPQGPPAANEETDFFGADLGNRCPERPTTDTSSTTAKLHGSWRVVAAYSDEDMEAFCPELHMCLDPADFERMMVFWTKAEPYREVLPRGHMTMTDNGNLEIPERFEELQVVKLDDKFLILRVWNPDFQRTFILSPLPTAATDEQQEAQEQYLQQRDSHEEEVESNLFGLLVPIHVEMQMTDGPEWYICSLAGIPVRSSAQH